MPSTAPTARLAQLQADLQAARTAQAMYQSHATEAYALAAEHNPGLQHSAYISYAVRQRGQALVWGQRAGELMVEIADLERGRAASPVDVTLSAEQCAAVDDTQNFRAAA